MNSTANEIWGYTDKQWDAISAIGTLGAAVIAAAALIAAVAVPVIIHLLENSRAKAAAKRADERQKREQIERIREATSATFNSIRVLNLGHKALLERNVTDLEALAAQAQGWAATCRLLAGKDLLTDGPIFAALNSAIAMDLFVQAQEASMHVRTYEVARSMILALEAGRSANERAIGVRKWHKIPAPKNGFPSLPPKSGDPA